MRKKKQPKPATGTAIVPHTGDKGVLLSYESPRIKISIEVFGNILKYREFWKLDNGEWQFARSCFAFNNLDPVVNWKQHLTEYRERIARDAKQGQGYLTCGTYLE